jgi:hypothetical protein
MGKRRIMLLAEETFSIATKDFPKELEKMVATMSQGSDISFKTIPLIANQQLKLIQAIPSRFDATREAVLVRAAFVIQKDQTIQLVSVYANPEAARNPSDCVQIAEKILRSVTAGSRSLNTAAGTRRLYAYSNSKTLLITLPAGYVSTLQQGPDFLVHRIRKVQPFGADFAILGIYIGGHPAYHYARNDPSQTVVTRVPGTLLGQKGEWFYSKPKSPTGQDKSYRMEVIVPAKRLDNTLFLHVFLTAGNEKELAEFQHIAETLLIAEM